jgi:ATP-binding cassette subfamily B protein
LLKTAPIIIVDEAPSSLDIDSEIAVHRSLLCLMRDRTVIAVAHRLSTMAAFDCILVMEGGTIVQEGTPKACRRLRSS